MEAEPVGVEPGRGGARWASSFVLRVEDTRVELLPQLMKLSEDEDGGVRLAAFDTVINLMELLDGGESSVG